MTVWVEGVDDAGSATWGCDMCVSGGWCTDRAQAWHEARAHAKGHGVAVVAVLARRYGPRPSAKRDAAIAKLMAEGATIRVIAAAVGLSTAGVVKARRRITRQQEQQQ